MIEIYHCGLFGSHYDTLNHDGVVILASVSSIELRPLSLDSMTTNQPSIMA